LLSILKKVHEREYMKGREDKKEKD